MISHKQQYLFLKSSQNWAYGIKKAKKVCNK
jgi:hypothetical protein